MSCCGKSPTPAQEPMVRRGPPASADSAAGFQIRVSYVEFEYLGNTRLSIRGPFTGQRYDFGHPGAVSAVDSRDATYFTGLPKLRMRPAG